MRSATFNSFIDEIFALSFDISQLPRCSFSRQSRTLGGIRDDNTNKTVQDAKICVASLEKEKELALINRKLAEQEAEKAAEFPTNASLVNKKTFEVSHILQIIIQE